MKIKWGKICLVSIDMLLLVYLVLAMSSFNKPDETGLTCKHVDIIVEDENNNGFLNRREIKEILQKNNMYPSEKLLIDVNLRNMEEFLRRSPFVKTAQCSCSKDGIVTITVSQRLPVIRIKGDNGADYYLDDNGGRLPDSKYNSDLIVATGNFSYKYAMQSLSLLGQAISSDAFWNAQLEQINVTDDGGIELVPRVGNHIVYIGKLPYSIDKKELQKIIPEFVKQKLERLKLFYKYGLSKAGWNKYSYINMEFDNQIICKNRLFEKEEKQKEQQVESEEENADVETSLATTPAISSNVETSNTTNN